ncbi:MAG: exodeoxyribonuclease III [Deltaproteobacteria bacterium HGW-Deltaproteobacteria-22]|jgi:exodeoxyribonuclease-3|nr:MAG: exodeoxyribonuclease III [Deltaproteobacteria bacterium HGW-Deltaproteobacteria-22]
MQWLTWNVNGIRAVHKKGFLDFFQRVAPDVLCIQETKAQPDQVPGEMSDIPGYGFHMHSAQRKGYSGVATWTRQVPQEVREGVGAAEFDAEGRVLVTRHEDIYLYNIYFPNGSGGPERLEYKKNFYFHLRDVFARHMAAGEPLVVCGDFNTAHEPIDLARPRENEKNSGFMPVEREWLDTYFALGLVDIFRQLHPGEPGHYSWWDYRFSARDRNIGWRIDYFMISPDLVDRVEDCRILPEVTGSDHCPVLLALRDNPSWKG